MSQPSESPSTQEILASLLDFFAASPEDQSRTLGNYYKECEERAAATRETRQPPERATPHLHDPLVELTEALWECSSSCTTQICSETTFFVGPLPKDLVLVMCELSEKVDSILLSDQKKMFAPGALHMSEWQEVRQLASNGLEKWATQRPLRQLGLSELLCHVAD